MTPEQIERTFEFILEHEAQTVANLDRLTARLDHMAARLDHMVGRHVDMQSLVVKMTELAEIQSQRIDRNDAALEEFRVWQRDALFRLDQILGRLEH